MSKFIGRYTTEDVLWFLGVYETAYLDYGLEISKLVDYEGKKVRRIVYDNPHALSVESYGRSPAKGLEWDEAEALELKWADEAEALRLEDKKRPTKTAFREWTRKDWSQCLEDEADQLIEAFVPHGIIEKHERGE